MCESYGPDSKLLNAKIQFVVGFAISCEASLAIQDALDRMINVEPRLYSVRALAGA